MMTVEWTPDTALASRFIKAYLIAMSMPEREDFAVRCSTTYGHLRNVAYGQKPCGESLAINVERESAGVIRCEMLRPDVDWAVLRKSSAEPSSRAAA